MTNHDNLTLAHRYLQDLWNRGDLATVDAIVAADVTGHANGATFHGRETLKHRVGALWSAYAEPQFTIDDSFASGDRVLVRWTFRGANTGPYLGQPPTGRRASVTGMNIFRIAAGLIAEIWVSADDLGELEQLGLIKLPSASLA